MREIKFRAWDRSDLNTKPKMRYSGDSDRFQYQSTSNWDVMQFTGLLDKFGKEVYEGDIVKVRNIEGNQLVGFDVGWACYCFVYDTGEIMRKITPREMINMKVIGNIYENPDLLQTLEEMK